VLKTTNYHLKKFFAIMSQQPPTVTEAAEIDVREEG